MVPNQPYSTRAISPANEQLGFEILSNPTAWLTLPPSCPPIHLFNPFSSIFYQTKEPIERCQRTAAGEGPPSGTAWRSQAASSSHLLAYWESVFRLQTASVTPFCYFPENCPPLPHPHQFCTWFSFYLPHLPKNVSQSFWQNPYLQQVTQANVAQNRRNLSDVLVILTTINSKNWCLVSNKT